MISTFVPDPDFDKAYHAVSVFVLLAESRLPFFQEAFPARERFQPPG